MMMKLIGDYKNFRIEAYPARKYMSSISETRYMVVEKGTGRVLDDCHGYGFKTPKRAYSEWMWKCNPPEKDRAEIKLKLRVFSWLDENGKFISKWSEKVWEFIPKNTKPSEADCGQFLKDEGFTLGDFTVGDLMKYWKKWEPLKQRIKKMTPYEQRVMDGEE